MKKLLPFILLTSLLLSACSIDWDDEKDKKITELEKQIQDNIFEKKKECSQQEIDKLILKEYGEVMQSYSIREIFYSPLRQSCIGVIQIVSKHQKMNVWLYDILEKNWFSNVLYDEDGFCFFNENDRDDVCVQSGKVFENEIKKLKGE